jgi:hypothetical protein
MVVMKSFTKIELMLILVASLVCGALYWPALTGQPIWDDLVYWIYSPEMKMGYLDYWRFLFSWPLSFTVQKFMLENFGENYLAYHLLSFGLHVLNSGLLYWTAKRLNWPAPIWIFLLFLFHPANVISAGWMIQIKTLLCFLFAILSFAAFERGFQNPRWMCTAVLLFVMAMLCKASAVALPLLFLAYAYPRAPKRALAWGAPLILAAGIGAAVIVARNTDVDAASIRAGNIFELSAQTAPYYFWKTVLPLENAPIKGRSPAGLNWLWPLAAMFGLIFFARKSTYLVYVGAGFVMLLPFLGLVLAPYMSFTWVSDQHLYLALPFFLVFWVSLFARRPRWTNAIGLALLAVFAFKVRQTAEFFSDEDRFYRESLRADPGNVIAAFNYANTLAHADRTDEAFEIADGIHQRSLKENDIATQMQFADLEALRQQLIEFKDYKAQQRKTR